MKHLVQAAVVFLICLMGEALVGIFSLSFPSSVISMILLFLFLIFVLMKQHHIHGNIQFLQQIMAVFFVPSGVAIMENFDYLKNSLLPFLLICVITTVITFAATAYTVRFVTAVQQKHQNKRKGGEAQ